MSDALNPKGPSQPSINQAYQTAGNPVQKEPAEQSVSQYTDNQPAVGQRIPQQQSNSIDDATPSSLGQGVRGAGPGEESRGLSEQDVSRSNELTAEQMGAPGEDKVADAVTAREKSGAAGQQMGLESDLDRKKAEQAPHREVQKDAESQRFDVGGVLGQRGGPANPVGKGNYPNTGT